MRDPSPGSARQAAYRVLSDRKTPMTVQAIANALEGEHGYGAVQQAIQHGVNGGDVIREGGMKPYTYRLRTTESKSHTGEIPQNRAQGTINEALVAVLSSDKPLTLDAIFLALPIGWSRADAVAAIKEGVLEEWIKAEAGGWVLAGDPPAPAEPAPVPVSHMRERLQSVRCGLGELLRDAVRLQDAPPLIRCIANAYAEVDAAVGMTKA